MSNSQQQNHKPQQELTLVELNEKIYRDAYSIIKINVEELISNGKEMAALVLYKESINRIIDVYKTLMNLYELIYKNQHILEHYHSNRFKQLGHSLRPIGKFVNEIDIGKEDPEAFILKRLSDIGINYQSWFLKKLFYNKLEYMLKVLKVLIEPEFSPINNSDENETNIIADMH